MFRVLVVDDDIAFARTIAGDLLHQGFAVETATNADDALRKVQRETFDVLLTDLRLGDSDGMSLLAAVRDASPHTRAVLMSGFATARDYERAVELGAVRVLTKPFTPADLMQCIRQAVDCGSGGFHGSVHGLSLVDLLQMYKFGRRSVKIAVAGRSLGTLYMREGELVHAEHEGRSGETAVASILAMPEGTVSTSVMPPAAPHSIERDFQTVLLSALHAIDETLVDSQQASAPLDDDSFDRAFQPEEITAIAPRHLETSEQAVPPQTRMLQRTREINGYLAACMFLEESGGVVCFDGSIDLRPAASLTAEALRRKQQTLVDMGMDDEAEDVIVTGTHHYHLLHRLHFDIPAFIYLVLDRNLTNPTLALIELEHAVREQTFSKQTGE